MKKYWTLLLPLLVSSLACHTKENAMETCHVEVKTETSLFYEIDAGITSACVLSMISELASKMNVFPITVIAHGNGLGPINARERGTWGARYEVTFDQFELFYELKYLAQIASKENINDVVASIDQASPKEKALMLTMIFIYERTYRDPTIKDDYSSYFYFERPPILPKVKTDNTVLQQQWKDWINVLGRYAQDDTVVFPAITEDRLALKTIWENEQKRVSEMARNLGMLDPTKERNLVITDLERPNSIRFRLDWNTTKKARCEMPIEGRKLIVALTEYIYSQYESAGPSGIFIVYDNSSKEPKTLGAIATQLLKSRLPYDGDQ